MRVKDILTPLKIVEKALESEKNAPVDFFFQVCFFGNKLSIINNYLAVEVDFEAEVPEFVGSLPGQSLIQFLKKHDEEQEIEFEKVDGDKVVLLVNGTSRLTLPNNPKDKFPYKEIDSQQDLTISGALLESLHLVRSVFTNKPNSSHATGVSIKENQVAATNGASISFVGHEEFDGPNSGQGLFLPIRSAEYLVSILPLLDTSEEIGVRFEKTTFVFVLRGKDGINVKLRMLTPFNTGDRQEIIDMVFSVIDKHTQRMILEPIPFSKEHLKVVDRLKVVGADKVRWQFVESGAELEANGKGGLLHQNLEFDVPSDVVGRSFGLEIAQFKALSTKTQSLSFSPTAMILDQGKNVTQLIAVSSR